jgi:CheY-like chemotaxis protein
MGSPTRKQDAVFEAFSQADESMTRRCGGTDRGLSISSQLVRLMPGRLWVESEEGRGRRFHVTLTLPIEAEHLPASPGPGLLPEAPPAGPNAATRARVLLAEDSPVNQRVVLRMLNKRGHQVVVANTGVEALAAIEQAHFDVVLMDLQMPDMGGIEATGLIRERERTTGRHLRIIALTAHAMAGDRERCLAAGMDGHLTKPIDRDRLFEAVEDPSGAPAAAWSGRMPSEGRSHNVPY